MDSVCSNSVGAAGGSDAILDGIVGLALGLFYVWHLADWISYAQAEWGDYVPAGDILPSPGHRLVPFFIVNVLLAPWVEERLYRGYALPRISHHLGAGWGLELSSQRWQAIKSNTDNTKTHTPARQVSAFLSHNRIKPLYL